MSIGARIATWWPCSLPLPPSPSPSPSLRSGSSTYWVDSLGPLFLMSLCTILLLQLGELSTEARVWDHQRFRFFGRGETLGDVGSLGWWTSASTTSTGSLSCRSLRAHGHIFSLYFFGSCYVEIWRLVGYWWLRQIVDIFIFFLC